MSNNNLLNKFNRVFLLQGALIIITALLSVYFATSVIDEILIKEAIKQEADFFWKKYQHDEKSSLPDTLNLTGFLDRKNITSIDQAKIIDQEGFYEFTAQNLVLFISSQNNQKLYLIYNRGQVDSLAAYYGLFPLAIVLAVLYLSLWLTYRFSRRTLSPVIKLAEQVNKVDFNSSDFSLIQDESFYLNTDDDVRVLHDAILQLGDRLESHIERERNFTRDASHELRSPLTVINIATDMLLAEDNISATAKTTIDRIKRAIKDMEELTSAFLLLARESEKSLTHEQICINDVIQDEIERSELLKQKKDISINLTDSRKLYTHASDRVLSVLIGNLIRNAILYTEQGHVEITLHDNRVYISDSGKGMDAKEVKEIFKPYFRGKKNTSHGHGVGLTIVKRLSDRFNWPVSINSEPNKGTTVIIEFPDFQFEPDNKKTD